PVAPPDIYEQLEAEVEKVVCLAAPEPFHAVSLWYEDFSPTTDQFVCMLLEQNVNPFTTNPSL
ncbi:MAG: hypothetical protein QNJ70_10525, partial [Xenococcaceae cyanobacterium MO_207.B15]|nr:hypothetical protein [Xenococcaceae cyanobacterium MO_207.B15]